MDHVLLKPTPGALAARLGRLRGVDDDYELVRGVSRAEGFPADASFPMDDDFPDQIQLEDIVLEEQRLLVASEALVEFLQARDLANVEYLPVTVFNHKGRAVKEAYFIVNPLGLQDCLDMEKTVAKENAIDPELLSGVRRIGIDEGRIEPGVELFRMRRFPFRIVLSRSLAEAIEAAGFSGFGTQEIDKFKGK